MLAIVKLGSGKPLQRKSIFFLNLYLFRSFDQTKFYDNQLVTNVSFHFNVLFTIAIKKFVVQLKPVRCQVLIVVLNVIKWAIG